MKLLGLLLACSVLWASTNTDKHTYAEYGYEYPQQGCDALAVDILAIGTHGLKSENLPQVKYAAEFLNSVCTRYIACGMEAHDEAVDAITAKNDKALKLAKAKIAAYVEVCDANTIRFLESKVKILSK